MSINYKYTSDGKKVVVIGVLNSTETIVQEIFVTKDGGEIPSGEHFIVKSLHDEPAESWQAKETRKIKESYDRQKKEQELLDRDLRKARERAKVTIGKLNQLASKAAQEQLDTLEAFVSGEITHILQIDSSRCVILNFHNTNECESEEYHIESLKLLSLYGSSDGTLNWMRNRYSDGSGYGSSIVPARGMDDAVRIAQEYFETSVDSWRNGSRKNPPRIDWVKGDCADKIVIPEDVIEFWRNTEMEKLDADIARAENNLNTLRQQKAEKGKQE